jgi:hypothetical protein
VGGVVIENPYLLTPDEVLATRVQRAGAGVTPIPKEAEEWFSDVMIG